MQDDNLVQHDQLRLPGDFNPLLDAGLDAEQVYRETLTTTFNAPSGGTLRVERLKGSAGELALRVGETNEPFGVVNVGDPAKLAKKCEEAGLIVREREFAGFGVPQSQRTGFSDQRAGRREEVHRGLEQLARELDGTDERW